MKKPYWLVLVFLLWLVGASVWYILGVKGLSTDPKYFQPQPALVAVIEIVVMLSGAFIIGFGLAWWLREEDVQRLINDRQEAEYALQNQRGALDATRKDYEQAHQKLLQAEERIGLLIGEKESLMRQVESGNQQVQKDIMQARENEARAKQQEAEITSMRFRIRILENEVDEKTKQIVALQQESSKPTPPREKPAVAAKPAAKVPQEKDDLTQIKGIGPRFQQKLNSLDIYSFRQISELSGEEVERLAEVIEVFPDRIHRDNWIGQATKLYMKKTNKE